MNHIYQWEQWWIKKLACIAPIPVRKWPLRVYLCGAHKKRRSNNLIRIARDVRVTHRSCDRIEKVLFTVLSSPSSFQLWLWRQRARRQSFNSHMKQAMVQCRPMDDWRRSKTTTWSIRKLVVATLILLLLPCCRSLSFCQNLIQFRTWSTRVGKSMRTRIRA